MTTSTAAHADHLASSVLDRYMARIERCERPFLLGLSGLQGSGKSTLAQAITRLASGRGWPAVTLSLDDVYLTHDDRLALAREVHPLLATRGAPGTHDIALLDRTLDQLAGATPDTPVAIPRFDKGLDDRLPVAAWPGVVAPPRLIVLEGWCLGVTTESEAALAEPVNALERNEDPDGRWRRWVNRQLVEYAPLWQRLDALVVLQAPGWDIIRRWRNEAERPLRERHASRAMDAATLDRFLQYYERISRHALATLPARADWCIRLDADRRPLVPG